MARVRALFVIGISDTHVNRSVPVNDITELDRDALIQGLDTYDGDGDTDWAKVAETKRFAFIRVSHGLVHDEKFQRNWHGAKAAGVLRGPYHYFLPNKPLQEQIDYFLKTVGKLEIGDLPPVMDL